jgi:L-amino acid N-acyltransferase YncA
VTSATIRLATADDAEQIAAIYAPFVTGTAVSFEAEPPDAEEMARRIAATIVAYPWLALEQGGAVAGYAYAGVHRARAAYRWSVETAIYTDPRYSRMGLGRSLYTSLLAVLPLQGYYSAYAGITLPNAASVGLHEAMGFEHIGTFRKIGFKRGAWHDVGWWQSALQPHAQPRSSPLPLAAVRETADFERGLACGLQFLRL